MVCFRLPFVTLQNLSISKFVALAAISKSAESTRDTIESCFAFCFSFGAKKSGKQEKVEVICQFC